MVSFGTVAATLFFLFPLSSSHLLTMNMECYETPITDTSAIVEETHAAFKSGKTSDRKEQGASEAILEASWRTRY